MRPASFLSKYTLSVAALVAAGLMLFAGKYLHHTGEISAGLYKATITLPRIGGVPLVKGNEVTVDVMQGLPTEFSCDYVPPKENAGEPQFELSGDIEAPVKSGSCSLMATFNDAPGTLRTLSLNYKVVASDGSVAGEDSWELKVRVVKKEEFFKIRALETPEGEAITGLSVPYQVVPFAEAALEFGERPEDYTVLFFVSRLGEDRFAVQFTTSPDKPGEFQLITAPVKRFRSWGAAMIGLAAWPGGWEPGSANKSLPISIGTKDDSREAFEILAVMFRTDKLSMVQQETVGYDVLGEEQIVFRPIYVTQSLLKELAHKGLVSQSLRVVRARTTVPLPSAAPAPGTAAPVPAPAAPAPASDAAK